MRNTARIVKNGSQVGSALAGVVIVRITWITAILVSVLAILGGLLSGTDGRDSSQPLPGFAFTDGGGSPEQSPAFALFEPAASVVGGGQAKTAAPQDDRSQRTKEQAPGDSYSSSDVPHRSGSQPKDAGGRALVVTPRPRPPQAPSETRPRPPQPPSVTRPNLPQAPSVTRPTPPQTPSETPVSSQPPASVSVSAPATASVSVSAPAPSATPVSSQPPVSAPVETSVTVANNSAGLP
jgi:hypothetical protein